VRTQWTKVNRDSARNILLLGSTEIKYIATDSKTLINKTSAIQSTGGNSPFSKVTIISMAFQLNLLSLCKVTSQCRIMNYLILRCYSSLLKLSSNTTLLEHSLAIIICMMTSYFRYISREPMPWSLTHGTYFIQRIFL
jgi:hypothetical protein